MSTPNVFFTSDLHLNHKAPVEKGWRKFDSVGEMNECIIQNWNEAIRPCDQVWVLGDVFLGNETEGLALVRRLNGEKHVILGNHDRPWPGNRDGYKHFRAWLESFETIQSFARRRIAGQNVLLSHFPYAQQGDHTREERYTQYRLPFDGLKLLHGHVHSEWKATGANKLLNVGVDVWDFKPVPMDTVAKWVTDDLVWVGHEQTYPTDTSMSTESGISAGTPSVTSSSGVTTTE